MSSDSVPWIAQVDLFDEKVARVVFSFCVFWWSLSLWHRCIEKWYRMICRDKCWHADYVETAEGKGCEVAFEEFFKRVPQLYKLCLLICWIRFMEMFNLLRANFSGCFKTFRDMFGQHAFGEIVASLRGLQGHCFETQADLKLDP